MFSEATEKSIEEQYWREREENIKRFWGKGKLINELLELITPQGTMLRILELGCGEGHILAKIASILGSDHDYVGIDYNIDIIEKARSRYPGITFLSGDINTTSTLQQHKPFNVIIASNVLHELYSHALRDDSVSAARLSVVSIVDRISKNLSNDGLFVLLDGVEPDEEEYGHVSFTLDPNSEKLYSNFIDNYFQIIDRPIYVPNTVHSMKTQDFARFITKIRFIDGPLWNIERHETYQYFKEKDFIEMLDRSQIDIIKIEKFISDLAGWREKVHILEGRYPFEHIFIVGLRRS